MTRGLQRTDATSFAWPHLQSLLSCSTDVWKNIFVLLLLLSGLYKQFVCKLENQEHNLSESLGLPEYVSLMNISFNALPVNMPNAYGKNWIFEFKDFPKPKKLNHGKCKIMCLCFKSAFIKICWEVFPGSTLLSNISLLCLYITSVVCSGPAAFCCPRPFVFSLF